MKRFIVFLLFTGFHVLFADALPEARGELSGGDGMAESVVLEHRTLTDPGVRNMPSHTILVPKGWTVEGGAWWAAPAYFKVLPSQDITVAAPNGVEVRIAPHIAAFDYRPSAQAANLGVTRPAEGASHEGYPVVHQPDDDAGWRRMMVGNIARTWPGASDIRAEDIAEVPQLSVLLRQRLEPLRAGQQAGAFCTGGVFAASFRYNLNGKEWEQLNVFGITNIGFDSEFGRNLYWGIEPNICYRAPEGRLEEALPLLVTIANSLGHTPEWTRMVTEHARKINQAATFRPSILHEAGKSVGDIMFEGWKKREAITAPSQRRVVESIHDVTTYNSGDGTVQLPAGYDRVYTNGLGDYVLTNDRFYEPDRDADINSQEWRPIDAVR
jgi:hypothetical protein